MARRKPVGYLPPSSEDATVNEKYTLSNEITPAASTEEKLAWLDQEINLLHTYCTSKGLNPWEVEKSAEPFFENITYLGRKDRLKTATKVCLILLLVFGIWYYEPTYHIVCVHARLAVLKVLPYWDWTALYQEECLVENPYYAGAHLTDDDCEMCEDLEIISRISNISQSVMTEDHLKRDIPVIITDGMDDWEEADKLSMLFIKQLYQNEENLKDHIPCMFSSNVRVKVTHPRSVLNRAARGDITNWYAHWENCDKQAAKSLRQFYSRPYFVPPMVEMAESNWLLIASNYKGRNYKMADIALPMMIIAQLRGSTKIRLSPNEPCQDTCPTLYATLHEKEMLITTDLMWKLDYLPQPAAENVIIGIGGYFD